jgi:ADP-heptose:LPS heptosyltransferase
MNGWLSFLAKRSALIDLPFSKGWAPVRNRYRTWASLTQVRWDDVESFYRQKRPVPQPRSIAIHVGAQWGSRQYPHVAELASRLRESSDVRIIAGPTDQLPNGVVEDEVSRLTNEDLVNALRESSHVIANDSGPMHLAAFLRCRTTAITRQADIREWLPPTALAVESTLSPKGYKAASGHLSDVVSSGWPTPSEVLDRLNHHDAHW